MWLAPATKVRTSSSSSSTTARSRASFGASAEHPFGVAVGVVDLGEKGEGPVLDVDGRVLGEPDGAVPVAWAANRALTAVLDRFTPVLRRAERLRFSSMEGRASVARHDELIRLCAAGDAEGAAAIAFDTFHSRSLVGAVAAMSGDEASVVAEDGGLGPVRQS